MIVDLSSLLKLRAELDRVRAERDNAEARIVRLERAMQQVRFAATNDIVLAVRHELATAERYSPYYDPDEQRVVMSIDPDGAWVHAPRKPV